ncbi:hypothetical protein PCASD_17005 [Puccinia coronata f. sp. avenae]|uniref:Uncharacterized protein n=1 Tax=Puccinia coronata f. sp. avenae TaxID=200324 RepID=A0A2N5T9Z0_9BASI|nr:hypothetical protein PCASD_17005 [Puccinia coronata f. sp. avenae]
MVGTCGGYPPIILTRIKTPAPAPSTHRQVPANCWRVPANKYQVPANSLYQELDSGTPKKKGVRGLHAFPTRHANPARPPPHVARRPYAYKWREDGRLGVRPCRTGVLAMHACPEGVQALHALRTGVHGRHACPARLT